MTKKKQESLTDFMVIDEDELASIKPTYIHVGKDKTDVDTSDITILGYNQITDEKYKQLGKILDEIRENQPDSIVEDINNWFITQCWENDIAYTSIEQHLDYLNISSSTLDYVYADYKNNHSRLTLVGIVAYNTESNNNFTNDMLESFEFEIIKLLKISTLSYNPTFELNRKTYLSINIKQGTVTKQEKTLDYMDKGVLETLLTIAPIHITEYENLDYNQPQLFKWTFVTRHNQIIEREAETLEQTIDWIKTSNKAGNSNVAGTLCYCQEALYDYSIKSDDKNIGYSICEAPLNKGFHIKKNEIVVSDYDLYEYNSEEIKEALNVLDEYKNYFTLDEMVYLATTFKWGLFAPFNLCYKQKNHFMEWLYLHGEGGVGKSLGYGGLVGHLWFDEFNDQNFYKSTDTYGTKARFGNVLSQSTFPLCFNETESVFEPERNTEMRALYKDAVESVVLRKTMGSSAHVDHSYSAGMCTSNGYIQDTTGAITRRSMLMCFSMKIRDTKIRYLDEFNEKYHIKHKDCKLNKLRAISHTFAAHLMKDIELLNKDWKEVVDDYLTGIYAECNMVKPEWLTYWVDNQDSIDIQAQESKERFVLGIQKIINSVRKNKAYIEDPEIYVMDILKGNYVPGLYINYQDKVFITQTFLDDFVRKGYLEHKQQLHQFSQNYDWNYENKTVSVNSTKMKGCWKYYNDFIEWVYGDVLNPISDHELSVVENSN